MAGPSTDRCLRLVPSRTVDPPDSVGGSRRVRPTPGRPLRIVEIAGDWSVGTGAWRGVFAVVWCVEGEYRWAPLHDFAQEDQLQLITQCADSDRLHDPNRLAFPPRREGN